MTPADDRPESSERDRAAPDAASRAPLGDALVELLFASDSVGLAVLDRALRYVRVNGALAEMNGRAIDAHVGRRVDELVPPGAAEALVPLLRRVLDAGEPALDLAFAADIPGQATRSFLSSYFPTRDADGTVTGLVALVAERTPAELALRETEGRLRRVAESGIVGLFFWSMDGGISEANDAFLSMLGYTQADLAAGLVDWRRMTPPEYAPTDEAAVRELVATGRHGQLAKEYLARDGRRVPVVVTSALLDGSRERGVCICLDDTARRAAEARLGRVLAQTPAAVAVLLGPDHVVQSTNEMFLRLLGRREYVGRPAREGAPELVAQGFVALMDDVYRTGTPFQAREAPLVWDRDGDGTLYEGYFDFVYQPLVDPEGQIEGILVFAVEVTAQVRARKATERASARMALLQALTAAFARARTVDDVADVIVGETMATAGAATGLLVVQRTETSEGEVVRQSGLPPAVVAPAGRFPLSHPGPAASCLRSGEAQWAESREELVRRFPEIARVWDEIGAHALATVPLTVAGETVGAMSFTFSAPRRLSSEDRAFFLALGHQAALALERARLFAAEHVSRREAELANRAKSEFLAVMSHELRTPLNAIAGYAELLEMGLHGPVTAQQTEALLRIQRSQRHLLGLINEVLNYARLETGGVRYDVVTMRVCDALLEAEGLVAPQARARLLTLAIEQCPDDLLVRADAEKVRQILVNLLSNAVKFTERGGLVTVSGRAQGGLVRIDVRDTGIGIPREQQHRIFEPFVQVRADLTRPHDGTGLGLAISRDLARGMGGDVLVESEPGVGSTFTVLLPAAVGAAASR
ncbi:MAG TPA: PAS domain-containing protein [Gemmatimonadaceae bacterium]|nr:PAS domain-containing protein [Gemmatimonadaceae bacterium]